jgi:gamma-carbonic anhydrase
MEAGIPRHSMIIEYKGIRPKLGKDVFIAPGVVLLGDVEIGDSSNLWFYTVVRADVNYIRIGRQTNIQDLCALHVTSDKFPLIIGDEVIVGHRAVLHGATIYDGALIGIGALVLDGCVIEEGAAVAAGAVVSPGTIIPANKVAVGVPARPIRNRTEDEREFHMKNSQKYRDYGNNFSAITRILE